MFYKDFQCLSRYLKDLIIDPENGREVYVIYVLWKLRPESPFRDLYSLIHLFLRFLLLVAAILCPDKIVEPFFHTEKYVRLKRINDSMTSWKLDGAHKQDSYFLTLRFPFKIRYNVNSHTLQTYLFLQKP